VLQLIYGTVPVVAHACSTNANHRVIIGSEWKQKGKQQIKEETNRSSKNKS
jgi:phosphotransferase system IIB component